MPLSAFIDPMLLVRAERLPEGAKWSYELKLDGYRALAIKSGGRIQVRSRNNKDFNRRYPAVVNALAALPDDTIVDGEVVALDEVGRPAFNLLQNLGSEKTPVVYYIFDVPVLNGRDVMAEPLSARRALLCDLVLPQLGEPVRESAVLEASLADLIALCARRPGRSGGQAPGQPL